LGGTTHGLFEGTIPAFAWWNWEGTWKTCQKSSSRFKQCLSNNSQECHLLSSFV